MTTAAGAERHEHLVDNPTPARLDAWLASQPSLADCGLSRSDCAPSRRRGTVTVNGVTARPAQRLRAGDVVVVLVPPARPPANLIPQDIPITVIHEDADIVGGGQTGRPLRAPRPGPSGWHTGQCPAGPLPRHSRRGWRNPARHRAPTGSGHLRAHGVVAKNQLAHQRLTDQMRERSVQKEYLAATVGVVTPDRDTINAPIARHPYHRQRMAVVEDGRAAVTHYRSVDLVAGHTLLEISLETGRTHQIRVHLAHRRFPILGDPVYGRPSDLVSRQFLHAARLAFHHPGNGSWVNYRAPLPPELARAWDALRNRRDV